MGRGRGFSAGGGTTRRGGGGSVNVTDAQSLISAREGKRTEVDKTLTVLRDVSNRYDVQINDAQVVTLGAEDRGVLAYYNIDGNIAVHDTFFDSKGMDTVYDRSVASGFHPSRGDKSGMEAVVAHEMGHALTDHLGMRQGRGRWAVDSVSQDIVHEAARRRGMSVGDLRASISGYAKESNAEAVAEAYADVYCNGARAGAGSRAIVSVMDEMFGV